MKTRIWFVAVLSILFLALGSTALGDNLQIQCTAPTTCAAGGIQTTSSSSPTFNIATTNTTPLGNLYLAIIVPGTGGVGGTVTVNGITSDAGVGFTSGSLWTSLGETTQGTLDHKLSSTQSFEPLAGLPTTTVFTTYDVFLGSFTGTSQSVSLSGAFPAGTQFVAFTEDSNGNIELWSPNSASLIVTPEPGSLLLLGTGFAGVAGLVRRKANRKTS